MFTSSHPFLCWGGVLETFSLWLWPQAFTTAGELKTVRASGLLSSDSFLDLTLPDLRHYHVINIYCKCVCAAHLPATFFPKSYKHCPLHQHTSICTKSGTKLLECMQKTQTKPFPAPGWSLQWQCLLKKAVGRSQKKSHASFSLEHDAQSLEETNNQWWWKLRIAHAKMKLDLFFSSSRFPFKMFWPTFKAGAIRFPMSTPMTKATCQLLIAHYLHRPETRTGCLHQPGCWQWAPPVRAKLKPVPFCVVQFFLLQVTYGDVLRQDAKTPLWLCLLLQLSKQVDQ